MSLSSTDYALLAQDAYQDPVLNKPKILGGVTYEAIDVENNPRTGFQATAYKRMDTGEIVIAYRGTEFDREPIHDGGVDAGMVLAGVNLQTANSEAFTERVLEKAKIDAELHHRPLQVTVTGHSLGGTLAEINASKYGLKGETFNAYGAAGLREGVPEGGNQVIDHVRAGDVVSAASPHFGQVRVYAAQKDIDTLSHAGYRDDGGILSVRNPIKAIDFDAHAIDNFVPNSKLLGQSIINPENQARYKAHEGMIDRYRNDVGDVRVGLSAAWEIPKAIGEFKDAVEHKIADGVHAVEDKAASAWNTIRHPGSWFDHDKPVTAKLDDAAHPDHPLFKQARDAVHRLDASHQRTPDQRSENIAAALTVAARRDGLHDVNHAVINQDASRIYGVQGDLNSPLKRVAEVPTEHAAATPVSESSRQWQQLAEQARREQPSTQPSATPTQTPQQHGTP